TTPLNHEQQRLCLIHQLRIYEIFEQNKREFHNRFRDHASRIMKSYGFNIVGAWETRSGNRTEFVYLLSWPDEQAMKDAWEKFRTDEEWQRMKRLTNQQYGELVGEIEDRTLVSLVYGPVISQSLTS